MHGHITPCMTSAQSVSLGRDRISEVQPRLDLLGLTARSMDKPVDDNRHTLWPSACFSPISPKGAVPHLQTGIGRSNRRHKTLRLACPDCFIFFSTTHIHIEFKSLDEIVIKRGIDRNE
jgi:hypothetical protein